MILFSVICYCVLICLLHCDTNIYNVTMRWYSAKNKCQTCILIFCGILVCRIIVLLLTQGASPHFWPQAISTCLSCVGSSFQWLPLLTELVAYNRLYLLLTGTARVSCHVAGCRCHSRSRCDGNQGKSISLYHSLSPRVRPEMCTRLYRGLLTATEARKVWVRHISET